MPEVQNVGAADYEQYQPTQYVNDPQAYQEDYAQPEVYDERAEQMKAASRSRLGATFVSVLISAGIGVTCYYIGKRAGKGAEVSDKTMDAIKKELEDLKNSEAVKNYDKLKQSAEEVEKFVEEKSWYNFHGVTNKIKEAFGFLKADSKKAAEEVKDDAAKAAETAKEEAKKATEESGK